MLMLSEYERIFPAYLAPDGSDKTSLRAINTQNRSRLCRNMALADQITSLLFLFYEEALSCIQSLAYSRSSQQGAHSDLYLVNPPYIGEYNRASLCAAWIACEDADEKNGGLIIYPGSHHLTKPRYEDCSSYQDYSNKLIQLCEDNSIKAEVFHAKKGDVLIWHGDFVHAGGIPIDQTTTRASLVCHYARIDISKALAHGSAAWCINGSYIVGCGDH